MSAENRLSADQLAELSPGDVVTIESGADFGRRRFTTGIVARITDRQVIVRCGAYLECYRLRDGLRDGGAGRAELVTTEHPQEDEAQRRVRHIDRLYREWTRNRADLQRLQHLHAALGDLLDASTPAVR